MGQVYRAHDTKLDREVALKLLPPEMASDSERLARFEREARVLASLNHPNIAHLYGLETVSTEPAAGTAAPQDSQGSPEAVVAHASRVQAADSESPPNLDSSPRPQAAGPITFLVMELAEGQDLSERLQAGPLPLADALEIARQIALGLEAAHSKGIIHRDLKPANVMIGPDGRAKILDFGLARAYDDPAPDHDVEHSPPLTAAMTQAGVILGTAAYMSPEQARGRAVDQRSDVWAFGVVLFEMITGSKAFGGETVSDMVARILEREPPWDELPQQMHPAVGRLLRRSLTKDPGQRLHSAADARLEIEEAQSDPTGAAVSSDPAVPPDTPVPRWRGALPWVLCLALAAAAAFSLLTRRAQPEPLVQFEITAPAGRQISEFRVSHDGSAVVFAANNRQGARSLWLRRLDTTTLSELQETEGATFPFWSPDGEAIAFFAAGKLRRLDLASGTVQTIADAANGRGGDWNEDGTVLFTPEGSDVLYSVPASGGSPTPVTTLSEIHTTHRFPHFLAGSGRFVFSAHGANSTKTHRFLGSLDSDRLFPLPDGMSEAYAPPGFLLYIVEGTLVAQEFDEATGDLSGERFPLASGINDMFPRTASSAFSVSDNGVLAFLQAPDVDSHFRLVSRDGRVLGTMGPEAVYTQPQVSRDGDRITFVRGQSAWLLDLVRGTSTRLPTEELGFASSSPTWFGDDSVVLNSMEGGIVLKEVAGEHAELIFSSSASEQAESLQAIRDSRVSPDGSFLAFSAWDPTTDYDLWVLRIGDESEPQRLGATPRVQQAPSFSPNGRWIAYESDESGRYEVYVRSAGPGDTKWLISTGGGTAPLWSEDGTELFYISSDDEMLAVSIADSASRFEAGLPTALFRAPLAPPLNRSMNVVVEPRLAGLVDGNFLFQVPAGDLPPRTITVVLNWQQLLKR